MPKASVLTTGSLKLPASEFYTNRSATEKARRIYVLSR